MKTKHRNSYHLVSVVEDGLEKQPDAEGVRLSYHGEGCESGSNEVRLCSERSEVLPTPYPSSFRN